jgi:hypothetical protein
VEISHWVGGMVLLLLLLLLPWLRFETLSDLDLQHTTIEEREEYEQHIKNGVIVYAGVVSHQL